MFCLIATITCKYLETNEMQSAIRSLGRVLMSGCLFLLVGLGLRYALECTAKCGCEQVMNDAFVSSCLH